MAIEHGKGLEEVFKNISVNLSEIYNDVKEAFVYDNKRRYAVIVIDMLNDFVYGKLGGERFKSIIPNIQSILDWAREHSIPVIYSNDSHRVTDFEIHRWGEHAIRGTKGAEVIKELEPKTVDFIVPKTSYSGFYNTDLDSILRALYNGEGANTLILTGLHTDICVRHTAADAFFRGYEIIIPHDAVNSFTDAQHFLGLKYLRYAYLTKVYSTKDIIKSI
ncbi:isochorismatase family cysteine hydrolase [Sulfolobus tengchongensis]|uniref:Isochorismatase family cysteine hydrolase n=1 Tax=Sulfolobus tengchongensis TaxID=207809 RepID=A0AAX4L480_9CREN